MKKIIPQGKHKDKSILVDDEDYPYLSQFKWYINSAGYALYNYRDKNKKLHSLLIHRVVNKTPKGLDTDHVNGNKLDNQKSNLRTCSRAQNAQNRRHLKNKYGFKGVSYNARDKRYVAVLKAGCYKTPEEAAIAYDKAARLVFGEFAATNFDYE